jgi:hypothetical protein
VRQPIWEYIDNLGDASPLDYGGLFLYHDTTGVYGYELEKLVEPCDEAPEVPYDYPVTELDDDDNPPGRTTCYTCGRSWDDRISTALTPVPSGRCPFEPYHDNRTWKVYRVLLDRCQVIRSEPDLFEPGQAYLVPASYRPDWPHPVASYVEWFAEDLASVAECMGTARDELVTALCSEDGKERAWAYDCIYDYHGWENGDSYPSELTRDEVTEQYTRGEI